MTWQRSPNEWHYTAPDGSKWAIAIPMQVGESFEDWLARVAPIVRDALKIAPAPDLGLVEWAELLRRNGIVRPDAGSTSNTGRKRDPRNRG